MSEVNKMIHRRIRKAKVNEIMTTEVISIDKDQSIGDLMQMFEKYDFNSFPVVENGMLIGIVTKLDLLKAFSLGLEFHRIAYLEMVHAEKVRDIMRKSIVSLGIDETVKSAIEYMIEFSLRSLPVVDKGKLVGMVSRKDVVRCLEMISDE